MAEFAPEYHQQEELELPRFDLAEHIASSALRDPTYNIDYTNPNLVEELAKELSTNPELQVRTPTVYAAGSSMGRLALRVRATQVQLAQVIPFPNR